jgi:hypothetical protein
MLVVLQLLTFRLFFWLPTALSLAPKVAFGRLL